MILNELKLLFKRFNQIITSINQLLMIFNELKQLFQRFKHQLPHYYSFKMNLIFYLDHLIKSLHQSTNYKLF